MKSHKAARSSGIYKRLNNVWEKKDKIAKLDLLSPDKQFLSVLLVPIKVTDRHHLILERGDR